MDCGTVETATCGDYARQLAGTKRLLEMVPDSPLPDAVMAEALAYNMQTPPCVRRVMVIDRGAARAASLDRDHAGTG